jgi:hypothetical protein
MSEHNTCLLSQPPHHTHPLPHSAPPHHPSPLSLPPHLFPFCFQSHHPGDTAVVIAQVGSVEAVACLWDCDGFGCVGVFPRTVGSLVRASTNDSLRTIGSLWSCPHPHPYTLNPSPKHTLPPLHSTTITPSSHPAPITPSPLPPPLVIRQLSCKGVERTRCWAGCSGMLCGGRSPPLILCERLVSSVCVCGCVCGQRRLLHMM